MTPSTLTMPSSADGAAEVEQTPLPVYLIHWNAPDWLRSSVESLRSSTGCEIAIVVIDNSGNLPAEFDGDLHVITPPSNGGYTGGANQALEDAQKRFPSAREVVIAAHDLHVEPTTLSTLRQSLRANPELGIVGPKLASPTVSYGGVWDGRRAHRLLEPGRPQWLSGTLMMIRRECSDEVGFFDTTFGSYCEDVDYGLRAGDLGWTIAVVDDVEAWGLGSIASDVNERIDITNLRLAVKRSGRTTLLADISHRTCRVIRTVLVSQAYGVSKASTRSNARASIRARVGELRSVLAISGELLWRRTR